jgi:spoIIIJ-associated protein
VSGATQPTEESIVVDERDVVEGGQGFEDEAPDAEGGGPAPDDGKADKALAFIRDVIAKMGVDASVEVVSDRARQVELDIAGPDANILIGKRGSTLFALQFLTNRVVNRGPVGRRYVVLDVEGYRARRERGLAAVALKLGEQAVREGKVITFDPMSPRERRVVHLALAKFPGLRTQSEGEGDARRVQIIPTKARPR